MQLRRGNLNLSRTGSGRKDHDAIDDCMRLTDVVVPLPIEWQPRPPKAKIFGD